MNITPKHVVICIISFLVIWYLYNNCYKKNNRIQYAGDACIFDTSKNCCINNKGECIKNDDE
jgi:hypothetical protein